MIIIDVKKQGDVVALKLASGEEIIGLWQEQNNGSIRMRKPLAIVMTENGPAMAPYFATADVMSDSPEIDFNENAVVATTKAAKPFKDAYMQATTGIDTSAEGSKLII
tara:strand:- start:1012 stop:1335 length:324 start_codon:yes stop_codon:yes gene_type:complete